MKNFTHNFPRLQNSICLGEHVHLLKYEEKAKTKIEKGKKETNLVYALKQNHSSVILRKALLDMLRSLVSWVSCPHLGHGGCFPFSCLNTLLLVWSSQKQALQQRQECWPSLLHETHLNVSASKSSEVCLRLQCTFWNWMLLGG